jgi:replicative DNA helicase
MGNFKEDRPRGELVKLGYSKGGHQTAFRFQFGFRQFVNGLYGLKPSQKATEITMPNHVRVADLVNPFLDILQERADMPFEASGPCSGLRDLDRILEYFRPGELAIIGGRPAMGKTSLTVNIAVHTAIEKGLPLTIFSETTHMQMMSRLMATLGCLNLLRLSSGRLRNEEWPNVSAAIEKLRSAQICIVNMADTTNLNFEAEVREIQRKSGPSSLVLIDSLQIDEQENRAPKDEAVTRRLKKIAVELQIPIIATTHLWSSVEARAVKRPTLSDLIAAESIERDADIVMLVYREQYYKGGSTDAVGTAEVFVARNRNGGTACVDLAFRQGVARFENSPHQSSERG